MECMALREFDFVGGDAIPLAELDAIELEPERDGDAGSGSRCVGTAAPSSVALVPAGPMTVAIGHHVVGRSGGQTALKPIVWGDGGAYAAIGLGRLWSRSILLVAFGTALPLALTGVPVIGEIGLAVFLVALAGHVFRLVDHIARGEGGVALPDDELDTLAAMADVLFRALCCAVVVLGPALLRWWGGGWADAVIHEVLAALVFGGLLGPAVVGTVVHTRCGLSALNPFAWATVINRAGANYLSRASGFAVLELAIWAWWLTVVPESVRLPVFGPILGGIPIVGLRLVQAVVVGEMLNGCRTANPSLMDPRPRLR